MKQVEIFDPAMCCSTGVCGPGIDPELLRIATVIQSLQSRGININRHNLAEEPQVFITNTVVNKFLMDEGAEGLPVTLLDGEIVKRGVYPSNSDLETWLEIKIEVTASYTDSCCNEEESCCDSGCC